MFFATSILHVHLMHWDDVNLVEGAVKKCNEVWESIQPDKRQQCVGLLFYNELLHIFYLLRICDYKNAAQHVETLDAAMKADMQQMRHVQELTKELNALNLSLTRSDLHYRDRSALSEKQAQLEEQLSNLTGLSSTGKESLEPAYFGNVKRSWGDKLELAPPPIDGEWLPKSAVFALVDLMVVIFGRPKGLFKECGKRIQSGLQTIQEVNLQHTAIWMAGVYLMLLMQFLENKVAMELTRSEFVEAQEAGSQFEEEHNISNKQDLEEERDQEEDAYKPLQTEMERDLGVCVKRVQKDWASFLGIFFMVDNGRRVKCWHFRPVWCRDEMFEVGFPNLFRIVVDKRLQLRIITKKMEEFFKVIEKPLLCGACLGPRMRLLNLKRRSFEGVGDPIFKALVQMRNWFVRFPTILQACESIIEMLRGQYAHTLGSYSEATFHFIEAGKLTLSKSMQAMCQVYAAVSYICIGGPESSAQALDLIGPVYQMMDSFVGVREKTSALFAYGFLLMRQQNLQEARVRLATGLQIAHAHLGNLQLVSQYLTILGNLALALRDTGQAREILRSALTLAKKLYDIPTQIWVLSNLTALYQELGEKGNEMENLEYQNKKVEDLQKRLNDARSSIHHIELIDKVRTEVHQLHEHDIKRSMAGPSMRVNLDIPESVGLSTPAPASLSRLVDSDIGRRGKRKM
ncbi:tetratricopeptide repeat (TPR)-like superfamily protein [Actinidia rufa]|uniref:Tetratricopeptide repeat (TPR)-like superfamily protein n=1 Tax=Actinidia rufa TaxID=165716 RepID=A0A7J0FNH4_9ERIC|nr:tetratricopeptide repeat (TPR)-like superfamily protein [Actinidia rufa]